MRVDIRHSSSLATNVAAAESVNLLYSNFRKDDTNERGEPPLRVETPQPPRSQEINGGLLIHDFVLLRGDDDVWRQRSWPRASRHERRRNS